MELPIWQSAKVLKNGGECNDKGCLALELLDRSKICDSFITGTPIKFRRLTSNNIVYGVVKSIEKIKFFIEKADGLSTSTWLDALKSLSNNTLVHVQKIPTWEDPQLQVFYTQDKNDVDDSHNESGDEDAVGDVISDLLNHVSNTADESGLVDPFSPSDNPEQIVANINDAIVYGNINSSDLGTDLKTAGFRVNSVYQGSGRIGTMSADLISFVDIQKSTDCNFIVASIPANNPSVGFTYTTQVPFKVIQGRSSKLLSTLYNDFKSKKISVSMRVEDNNETTLFHKEINDVRAVTINGRQTYQFITPKDPVDGSMIGKYKNAMATFKVRDLDPAGNNTLVGLFDNTQIGLWFPQNEQKWTRACISVSYTPSKWCTFLPSTLEGITKPEVLGNVLNNCGFTPTKAIYPHQSDKL